MIYANASCLAELPVSGNQCARDDPPPQRQKGNRMSFNDSSFRVTMFGDWTYCRQTRESANRAACECLAFGGRGSSGIIEEITERGRKVVARFEYGHGIIEVPGDQSDTTGRTLN